MTRSYSKHDLTSLGVDTDVLRWFKKVAEGATVTEVSDLEGVTQSGVSRALARLEEQVGTPLLRRAGRRLRLTQAGEVFKPYVDALLHQLDNGVTAVSQFISPETGTVRLAFQQSLGVWLVPDLVRTFRAGHPAVGFHLTQVTDQLPVGPLAGGTADLEISTRVFPDGHLEPVRTRRIVVDPLGLAVPADHRLAGQPDVCLADVAAEPFISLRPTSGLRRLTEELCARAWPSPRGSSSRATTCPASGGSWPRAWASRSSPRPARARREASSGRSATWRSVTAERSA